MSPAPRDYRHTFDARGATYDDAMAWWPDARAEELGFAVELADPTGGERLLDVPAGGGYLADHLPSDVTYQALEVSAPFAARARERGLDVATGPLDGSSLPPGEVDVLVSLAGTHHEPDLSRLLTGWSRLLRPGGRLVVADVVAGSAPAAFLDGFVAAHNGTGHDATFLGPDLEDQARAVGLVDVTIIDRAYHWWFEDEAGLASYCTALFGLRGVAAAEVVGAVRRGPGIDEDGGRMGMCWSLRALVARRPLSPASRPV